METTVKDRLKSFLIKNQGWLLILISFVSLLFLIRQNWLLRGQLAVCVERERSVADKLQLSQDLMQLVGAPLPLAERLRDAAESESPRSDRIVVVFNPTTCGKGMREHLVAIRSFQERLGPRREVFMGLVGADTREDQSYALALRNSKLMTFPFSYVRSRELSRFFPLESETGFIETPIYLLVDRDFRIKSVFMPDSVKPEGLELWLKTRIAA